MWYDKNLITMYFSKNSLYNKLPFLYNNYLIKNVNNLLKDVKSSSPLKNRYIWFRSTIAQCISLLSIGYYNYTFLYFRPLGRISIDFPNLYHFTPT